MSRRHLPIARSGLRGMARLDADNGLPGWVSVARGAGGWSYVNQEPAHGQSFITKGTAQNSARFHYLTAAGRRLLLLEPATTNLVTASNILDAGADDVPDGWTTAAGVPGTDNNVITTGGPDGAGYYVHEATATASKGHQLAITLAAQNYCHSAWHRRTLNAAAANVRSIFDGAGALTYALLTSLHDWTRYSNIVTVAVAAGNVVYLLTHAGFPAAAQLGTFGVQVEDQLYATTWVPSTGGTAARAAELCALDASRVGASEGYVSFLWCPLWGSTIAHASVRCLFEWAPNWRLDFDPADDKIKVVVNGTNRAETAALTFAANSVHRVTVRYGSAGQQLTVDGVTTTNATAWGTPVLAPYLGSRAASANMASAAYGDLELAQVA